MFSNDCSLPNSIQPLSESKFVVYFLEFVSCNDFVGRLTGVRVFVKFSRNVAHDEHCYGIVGCVR